jgi:hypothetical protein
VTHVEARGGRGRGRVVIVGEKTFVGNSAQTVSVEPCPCWLRVVRIKEHILGAFAVSSKSLLVEMAASKLLALSATLLLSRVPSTLGMKIPGLVMPTSFSVDSNGRIWISEKVRFARSTQRSARTEAYCAQPASGVRFIRDHICTRRFVQCLHLCRTPYNLAGGSY